MANRLLSTAQHLVNDPWNFLFRIIQTILDLLLSPAPPPPSGQLGDRKIAIIGAGITGVSSAAHCVGHGFDVTLFEAGDRKNLGGIWARVNNTSGLQIHSVMYRFHPSVQWNGGYPNRKQILGEVEKLWHRYGLEDKTKFETRVTKCEKNEEGKYIINDDPSLGEFDGVIACVGTCGEAKTAHIKGEERFKGDIYHSSELDGRDAKDKNVIVIGGGASAIEALEFAAAAGAKKVYILARSEKWIIPRNPFINVLLALNIFGAETPFSWIPERLLRVFFYRDLADIAPAKNSGQGLFMETPMVSLSLWDLNALWLTCVGQQRCP
jgi:cation diffusion facilitator CzcD-associated flavoprotein CzcO